MEFIFTLILQQFVIVALAYLLYRKVAFFARAWGFAAVLGLAVVGVVSHNLFSAWLGVEEPVFFLLALIALGSGQALAALWLVDRGLRRFSPH